MNTHLEFMKIALKMATEAFECGEVPVGCAIIRGTNIIATGRNKTNELCNATKHAELVALDSLKISLDILKECSLYVTVEPCIMCAAALRLVGIKEVFFGCMNDRFGGNGSILSVQHSLMDIYPAYSSTGGFLEKESISLLRKFYLRENTLAPNPKRKQTRVFKDPFEVSSV